MKCLPRRLSNQINGIFCIDRPTALISINLIRDGILLHRDSTQFVDSKQYRIEKNYSWITCCVTISQFFSLFFCSNVFMQCNIDWTVWVFYWFTFLYLFEMSPTAFFCFFKLKNQGKKCFNVVRNRMYVIKIKCYVNSYRHIYCKLNILLLAAQMHLTQWPIVYVCTVIIFIFRSSLGIIIANLACMRVVGMLFLPSSLYEISRCADVHHKWCMHDIASVHCCTQYTQVYTRYRYTALI